MKLKTLVKETVTFIKENPPSTIDIVTMIAFVLSILTLLNETLWHIKF